MTRDDEDRLAEEGIRDVAALAMANPHRLRQATPYDRRQLLAWVDEALLVCALPQGWQQIEADGITGAIDLAWYARYASDAPSRTKDSVPGQVAELAGRVKLDPKGLWESILRLSEDAQLQLVWALYVDESDTAADGAFSNFEAQAVQVVGDASPDGVASEGGDELETKRRDVYERNRGLFVVHSWRPSAKETDVDIVLRVVRHSESGEAMEVMKVEYQLGPKFSKRPMTKTTATNGFALAVSAYGPFLCLARATMADGAVVILERYVDFDAKRTQSN